MNRLALLSTLSTLVATTTLATMSASAHADVWQHAIDPSPGLDVYEALMTKGDEAAVAANSKSSSIPQIRKDIDTALEAYRAAAKADPKSGEPFFRIGWVINSYFFDCEDEMYKAKTCDGRDHSDKAKEMLDAWDAFEAREPLDPRVNDILLSRAIQRTKMIGGTAKSKPLLEAAAKDYQAILDRADGLMQGRRVLALGNLAETQMMLGDLDEAITTYREAKRSGADATSLYGLAVAYDRDERLEDALSLIRSLGVDAYDGPTGFQRRIAVKAIFFVPAGEEEYYFGLCDEAFGRFETAIDHWKAFIRSGAHPQFQPRAKEHLDRLMTRKSLKWEVPLVRDLDFIPGKPRK